MKQSLLNHIKNIPGWRTKRKLVVFSVDDYGNVRVGSKEALINLESKGIKSMSHFDTFDTLETKEDLLALYDVLNSVKDKNNKNAILTPYSLSYNIDFDTLEKEGYVKYIGEPLTQTFEKLSAIYPKDYQDTWQIWQEGIKEGIMQPQFHGREHLNLFVFNNLLKQRNKNLITCLRNKSYVQIPEHKQYQQKWTSAYSFNSFEEVESIRENIQIGLKAFEEVYGYSASAFTPPATDFPIELEKELSLLGLKYLDRPRHTNRHLGNGRYKKEYHKLGDIQPIPKIVRNVVFEPTTKGKFDWVNFTLKQIEIAFFWGKPAHISSHRVNFCGLIDENNRKTGLKALQELLKQIIKRWPDVEFVSVEELGKIIYK